MELLGADADLSAETKLGAVGEAGAGVVVHRRSVNFVEETIGRHSVLRDDGFRVTGAVGLDVVKGVVKAVDHLDGGDQREEFLSPVVWLGGDGVQAAVGTEDREGTVVAPYLHAGAVELGGDFWKTAAGSLGMDENGIESVADRRSLDLGIEDNAGRHVGVGVAVDIGVADPDAAGQHGHGGVFGHKVDQAGATTRDEQVDLLLHVQHDIDQRAVGIIDELNSVGGKARLADGSMNQGNQSGVGSQGLLSAAQETRIARLESQGNDVGGDVGTALVHAGYDAEGNAPLFDLKAVLEHEGLDELAHGIGKGGNTAHVGCHAVEALRIQEETIQEGVVDAVGFSVAVIGGIDFQDRALLGL